MKIKKYLGIELCIFFLVLPLYVLATLGYKNKYLIDLIMNDEDFKNIEKIQRILKYLDNGKLDLEAWPNALELKTSLDKMINEHNEYMEHMKNPSLKFN